MARVKVKKAVKDTQNAVDMVMALHPDLPYFDDEEDAKKKDAASKPDLEATIANLQAQIKNLTDAQGGRTADLLNMMAQPVQPLPPRVPTEIDTKNLPDPVSEPEKYAKEIALRTKQFYDGQKAIADWEATQQQTANNKAAALWNEFQTRYPEYKDEFESVEFFATKAAKDAAAKGLDVEKYMYGQSDRFMADVKSRMDKVFGADEEDEADDEPDDRTVGMFGGQESGHKPNKAAEGPDTDPFKPVRDFQLRTGFHR